MIAHYTRHVRPNMAIIETSTNITVAAYDFNLNKLVLIYNGMEPQDI
jgi:hypothetical protein